jgi:hypothetical protein
LDESKLKADLNFVLPVNVLQFWLKKTLSGTSSVRVVESGGFSRAIFFVLKEKNQS